MKKLYKSIFVSLISITTFTACTNDEIAADNTIVKNKLKTITFTARQESDDETRAAFNEKKIEWRTDDQISVFDGSGNHAFTLTNGQGTTIGTFTGTAQESSTYVALYPYQAEATRSAGNQVEAKLPTEQTATPDSFDPKAGLMIAETNNETTLSFRNAVAYIKVTTMVPAKKIKFSSRGGEPLSGNVTLNYNGSNPTTLSSNGCSYVDLVPASGTTFVAGTYYLAVCPQTLSQGFILSYVDEGGVEHVRDYTKSYTIVRNKIINMGGLTESNTRSVVSISKTTFSTAIQDNKSKCSTIEFLVNQETSGTNAVWSTYDSGTKKLTVSTSAPKFLFTGEITYLLSGCTELTSTVGLQHFDTSNVTDMGYMFFNCPKLTSLNLSSFNTSNVTNIGYMFSSCSSLTSIDLSNFDTHNVIYMSCTFENCSKLTSIDLSSFDTKNVKLLSYMFNKCSSLTSIDLSSFNTGNVTSMVSTFADCTNMEKLKISNNFTMNKVNNKKNMFSNTANNLSGKKCQVINAPSATQTAMSSGTGWDGSKMEFATVTP